jgi:mono/diheme cytochrome c family protein
MKLHVLSFALATSVAVSFAACGGGLGDPTGATCPSGSTLSYENFGKAFFETNCNSCHGAGGAQSPKFDTVERIRASRGEIDRAAAKGPKASNDYMPDGRGVSDAERTKLGEWLACGAP